MMRRGIEFLGSLPQGVILAVATFMLAVLGALDVSTGYEISFSIFYLVPILFVAWFGIAWYAIPLSFLAAAIWLWADLTSGHAYAHAAIPAWNSVMRLGFFLIVALSIIKIRRLLEYEQATSRTDFLTRASNSRSFYESLRIETARSARSGRPYSVAYIDVDNFKAVNDSLGHSTGDELLLAVSSMLRQTTRSQDIVARLGGDEFAVLFPETSDGQARPATAKIREELLEMVMQRSWPVTFSIGVVTCTGLCEPDEIVRQADHLMYEVKHAGKNSIEYGTYREDSSGK